MTPATVLPPDPCSTKNIHLVSPSRSSLPSSAPSDVLPRASPRLKSSSVSQSTPLAEHPTPLSPNPEHASPVSHSKRKVSSAGKPPVSKKSKSSPSVPPALSAAGSVIPYFVDATKASNYQQWFAVRELWPEFEVTISDFLDLVDLLKSRHWSRTVSKLESPHPTLIREFYANLDKTILDSKAENCLKAFVRGRRISFSPSTIARALKVPKILNPEYSKAYSPDSLLMGKTLSGQSVFIWEGT